MKIKKEKNYMLQYTIYTYGLFLLLLLTLGGIAKVLLHGTPLVMEWLMAITAWTPTVIFLLMFKKLYPNSTVKDFYKNAFMEKLNIRLLVSITLIQIIIYVLSVYMVSTQKAVSTISLLNFSFSTLISTLFFTFIQGPAGEETGWRGYLLPAVAKKVGIVKGSLIVSLIWAFWHAPIWFLGTGYSGTILYKYIIVFVITITSVGFIIGICYHRCKNLFVPIWIHFIFNLLGQTFKGSMADLVVWYAVFYFIMAIGSFLWYKSNYNFLKSRNSISEGKN
jgi:membrane protease YdiL (CAAX protease family)